MDFRHTLGNVVPHIAIHIALTIVRVSLQDGIGLVKHYNTTPALCPGEGLLELLSGVIPHFI